jgi:hypothetical protein
MQYRAKGALKRAHFNTILSLRLIFWGIFLIYGHIMHIAIIVSKGAKVLQF